MGRETREMAVLFADVTNSTALGHKLGDGQAREVIELALSQLGQLVPRLEGRIAKTLGDAVMCVFGDAENAVRAACEMQTVLNATRIGGEALQLHLGLHWGPVMMDEGEVFGDTVNAAAYLTEAATADQVLATDALVARVSDATRAAARPVFQALLKGATTESVVYQILWRREDMEVTTVNLHAGKLLPRDTGSLLLTYGAARARIDQQHTTLTLGRSADCDLVVDSMFASRRHATIKLRRTRFYLMDHSTNGTYVWMRGEELHVLRGELLLDDAGEISLGRRRGEPAEAVLKFERDRRSMYRV